MAVYALKGKKPHTSQAGFTLIEMITVVAIIGIMLGLATPAFNNWRTNAILNSAAYEIFGSFLTARSEAVKRNTAVYLNFTDTGWQLYENEDSPISSGSMPTGVSITDADFETTEPELTGFDALGLPAESRSGSLKVSNSSRTYQITLSPAGHVKVELSL